MRTDLADDPAVITIAEVHDLDQRLVVGILHQLWCWFDSQTIDGNAPSVTRAFVDRYVGVTGFAQTMVSVGWLAVDESEQNGKLIGIRMPNFDVWLSQSAKARALARKRATSYRSRQRNAPSVTNVTPTVEKENSREKKEKRASPGTDPVKAFADDFISQWNANVPFSQIIKMTEKRLSLLRSRQREPEWLEHYLAAMRQIPDKPFLCGENDRGWKATPEWFLRPDTVTRIREGAYDGKKEQTMKEILGL